MPNEAALQGMIDSGMPEWNAKALAELYSVFATGEYEEANDNIQKILGRPATTFTSWAADNRAAFV